MMRLSIATLLDKAGEALFRAADYVSGESRFRRRMRPIWQKELERARQLQAEYGSPAEIMSHVWPEGVFKSQDDRDRYFDESLERG